VAGLRHDPDVIVVGEVRDPTTAMACVRAALTGHVVLTTLHAARCADVRPRMVEMGVDPRLLDAALTGIAAQRLVRTLHQTCRGEGCASCFGGFLGRRVLAELLPVDAMVRDTWRRGETPEVALGIDIQAARLVVERSTTAKEMERVLGGSA
jgi:general secretion pathway protein E